MFSRLMSSRRFAPLFWSQLLAALNDNLLKNALAMLVVYKLAMESGPALGTLAGAALVLPFFLFSALAGQLADKFDKAKVAARVRLIEIPIAVLAAAGFLLPSVPLLFVALILFGTLSAFFGPVKYGLLPSHLEVRELPSGNALIEGATFIAILIGTIGGNLASGDQTELIAVACAIVGISVLGWLSSRLIPPAPSSVPDLQIDRNILTSTTTLLKDLHADKRIWQGALITSWFWLVGAAVLALLQNLIPQVLNGAPSVYTLALFTFAVGVAIGSIVAARASTNRPNLALVPIGALLMGLFLLDLAWLASALQPAPEPLTALGVLTSIDGLHMLVDLAGIAIAGGLFIVPSFAAVQAWSPVERRSRVIAGCNVLSAAFMTLVGLAIAALQYEKASVSLLYAGLGIANIVVVALVLRAWGAEGVKDVGVFLFKTFFGLEVQRLREPSEAGRKSHHRPEPRKLPRRAADALPHAVARGLCGRYDDFESVVGETVSEARTILHHRSDTPARHAPPDPGREGRHVARHLPRRAPDRHRRLDESL